MKTLEYSLPALTLSFERCNKITKVVKKGLLNKSRVSTYIPNDSLYGPEDEGVMKLNKIHPTQGLSHLNKFVTFLASNFITDKLI